MKRAEYELTGPIGSKATLGLIVLQVDETIEHDFRRLFPSPEVSLYVSRIPSGAELTPETIADMETDLPRAAALLPPSAEFDVIGYACTSGTMMIGADRVAELVRDGARADQITDPLTAAKAAFSLLGTRSIGVVSPYIESVSQPLLQAFVDAGLDVPLAISFGEQVEARVARIDPESIRKAALEIGRDPSVDAVFLSCTNLRTLDIIDELEHVLDCPVVSSNQALAWHMAKLSKAPLAEGAPGRLMRA